MIYPKTIDIALEDVEETPSTNDYLAQLCREGKAKEFYTVTTDRQTAGKGQRGNTWESEEGKNLTFSTVLYPTALEAKRQFILSMLAAVAVIDALTDYIDGFCIKWPNDIYWNDRKIGGILIENELDGKYISQCIIGIGLNINQQEFRSDAPNPVSLCQIVGSEVNRSEIFKKIVHGIIAGYSSLEMDDKAATEAIRRVYLHYFYRQAGYHKYSDKSGEFLAKFHDVAPDGHLFLEDEQGTLRKYAFKEVSYILHE